MTTASKVGLLYPFSSTKWVACSVALCATHCPIQTLISDLLVDRPIYNETGLTGFYDFEITAALPFQTSDPREISPFSAVKEFGLKLEAKRLPGLKARRSSGDLPHKLPNAAPLLP